MAFLKYQVANDVSAQLDVAINATATSVTLKNMQNVPTSGNSWIGTLVEYDAEGNPSKKESILVASWSGANRTITRGQFGTTATTFAADSFLFLNVRSEHVQDLYDEATRLETAKANLASPALTGTPTAPTATVGTNTTQISTTAFVQAAIAALVDSSPATLDTLNELAAALGDDPNFATTMANSLAGKAPLRPVATKVTLVDADETTGNDSANSFGQIKTTWGNVKAFLKTYFDTLYAKYLGDADFYQYVISRTVDGSGNITISLLNYAGNTPTATAPVKKQVGSTIRTVTSACSITIAYNDYYHFNSWSAQLATKEIDYAVYLPAWGGLVVARKFHYRIMGDGTAGEWDCANNGGYTWTDQLALIWRFNAIKASGTDGVWSIPATSVIENRPINETRELDFVPTWISSGTFPAIGNGTLVWKYKIVGDKVTVRIAANFGSTSTYGTWWYWFYGPFIVQWSNASSVVQWSGYLYNGASYPLTPHKNYHFNPGEVIEFSHAVPWSNGWVFWPNAPASFWSGNYMNATATYCIDPSI